MFGKEPTEHQLNEAMRGWAEADDVHLALESAGLSDKEQLDAFAA